MQEIILPEDVQFIIDTLTQHGFEAYIVGGCVRDSVLGIAPKDWDITTSATPEEAKALFSHTFDTGIQHGTITVVLNKENYEVTTYRIDGKYEDCRRPNSVDFTRNLSEDLLRRDFTMNAIAYNQADGYQDPYHGIADIVAKTIRGVGQADVRFQEDALRMLRCVRFAAQLGFLVEEKTYLALQENAPLIRHVSVERIRVELEKLWLCPHTKSMALLWESGLLAEIDGVLDGRIRENVSLLSQIERAPYDAVVRWAVVLQAYTASEAKQVLKRLRFDNDTLQKVCKQLEYLYIELPKDAYEVRKLAGKIGIEAFERLLVLWGILRTDERVSVLRGMLEGVIASGDCLTLKQLAVNGADLMGLGVPRGEGLGEMLAFLLDAVQREPSENRAEVLLELAKGKVFKG